MRLTKVVVFRRGSDEFSELEINPEGITVISGTSRTGKSAVMEIIDYCFGAGSSRIPEREPFDVLSHVGIGVVHLGVGYLVVRSLDDLDECYLSQDTDSGRSRTFGREVSVADLKEELSEILGISSVVTFLPLTSGRNLQKLSIRTWIKCALLSHEDAISPTALFHRANEAYYDSWVLRESLPVFLGAYGADPQETSERMRTIWLEARNSKIESEREIEHLLSVLAPAIGRIRDSSSSLGYVDYDIKPLAFSKSPAKRDRLLSDLESLEVNLSKFASELQSNLDSQFIDYVALEDSLKEMVSRRDSLMEELAEVRIKYRQMSNQISFLEKLNPRSGEYESRIRYAEEVLECDNSSSAKTCPTCSQRWSSQSVEFERVFAELDAAQEFVGVQLSSLRRQKLNVSKTIRTLEADLQPILTAIDQRIHNLESGGEDRAAIRIAASLAVDLQLALAMVDQLKTLVVDLISDATRDDRAEVERNNLWDELELESSRLIRRFEHLIGTYANRLFSGINIDVPDFMLDRRSMSLTIQFGADDRGALSSWGSSTNYMISTVAARIALLGMSFHADSLVPEFQVLDQPTSSWGAEHGALQGRADSVEKQSFLESLYDLVSSLGVQLVLLEHDIPSSERIAKRYNWSRGESGLVPVSWFD